MQHLLMCASGCLQNPEDVELMLSTHPKFCCGIGNGVCQAKSKSNQNAPWLCTIHGNGQCWLVVCASQIPAGQGKNLNLSIVCFQHGAQEMFKNCWVCALMMVCTVISKNLKPNPAPARCWCTMPQEDSGLCKLCGRANEN